MSIKVFYVNSITNILFWNISVYYWEVIIALIDASTYNIETLYRGELMQTVLLTAEPDHWTEEGGFPKMWSRKLTAATETMINLLLSRSGWAVKPRCLSGKPKCKAGWLYRPLARLELEKSRNLYCSGCIVLCWAEVSCVPKIITALLWQCTAVHFFITGCRKGDLTWGVAAEREVFEIVTPSYEWTLESHQGLEVYISHPMYLSFMCSLQLESHSWSDVCIKGKALILNFRRSWLSSSSILNCQSMYYFSTVEMDTFKILYFKCSFEFSIKMSDSKYEKVDSKNTSNNHNATLNLQFTFFLVPWIQKTQRHCSWLDSWEHLLDRSFQNALVQLLHNPLDKFKIFHQCRTD